MVHYGRSQTSWIFVCAMWLVYGYCHRIECAAVIDDVSSYIAVCSVTWAFVVLYMYDLGT